MKLTGRSESVYLLYLQTFHNRQHSSISQQLFFKYEQKAMQGKDDLFIFVVKRLTDLFLDMMHVVKWPKIFPRCQVVSGSEAAGRILLKKILW